jgi:hypothetical protein
MYKMRSTPRRSAATRTQVQIQPLRRKGERSKQSQGVATATGGSSSSSSARVRSVVLGTMFAVLASFLLCSALLGRRQGCGFGRRGTVRELVAAGVEHTRASSRMMKACRHCHSASTSGTIASAGGLLKISHATAINKFAHTHGLDSISSSEVPCSQELQKAMKAFTYANTPEEARRSARQSE